MRITNLKKCVSGGVTKKTSAKILGGLILGSLLVTGLALPTGRSYADSLARPVTIGPSYAEQRLADSIEERFEVQRVLADFWASVTPTSESIEERFEVQRVLAGIAESSIPRVTTHDQLRDDLGEWGLASHREGDTSVAGGVGPAVLLEDIAIDPEDDPFGTITGYKDARMTSRFSTEEELVEEMGEWGMVSRPKVLPATVDFADEYEDEAIDRNWTPKSLPATVDFADDEDRYFTVKNTPALAEEWEEWFDPIGGEPVNLLPQAVFDRQTGRYLGMISSPQGLVIDVEQENGGYVASKMASHQGLVIDGEQENGSYYNGPGTSSPKVTPYEYLPEADDFYWPPSLENNLVK